MHSRFYQTIFFPMNPAFHPLVCGVQAYAWGEMPKAGAKPFIADLLSLPCPEGRPFAELWIGAHPNLSAKVRLPDGTETALDAVIRAAPEAVLGRRLAKAGARELPFLLKVLSCDRALSIQAHPDPKLAKTLHARDPKHYPDANPKPEIAVALTPFDALCRFRTTAAIRRDVGRLPAIRQFLTRAGVAFSLPAKAWLKAAYAAIFRAAQKDIAHAVRAAAAEIRGSIVRSPHDGWFLELAEQYPDDRGLLSLYFLNLVHLEPGEAVYIGANEPHAYLRGTILECMANSDNVVRAGLTPKFVDTDVLLDMLTYEQKGPLRIQPDGCHCCGAFNYTPPTPEFQLDILHADHGTTMDAISDGDVSLLVVLNGAAVLRTPQGGEWAAPRGSIWLWPACLKKAAIEFTGDHTEIVCARPNR